MNTNKFLVLASIAIVFGWIMSFPYEGPVMYALLGETGIDGVVLNFITVFCHFLGLFSGRFIPKKIQETKKIIVVSLIATLATSFLVPFITVQAWLIIIPIMAYFTGVIMSGYGLMIKGFIIPKDRGKAMADILIYGNMLLIIAHILAANTSPMVSYIVIELFLMAGLIAAIKVDIKEVINHKPVAQPFNEKHSILKNYWILMLFIFVITINSGIMFQVIYPYFGEFETLTSMYTNVPYIIAIFLLSRFNNKNKFHLLYVGIALWGITFILFSFLGQTALSFIIICSVMLFAAGIFDLFWWSIMANNFENVKSPSSLFGLGLSINVLGVWVGGLLGNYLMTIGADKQTLSFMGLGVVLLSMLIILPLNNRLSDQMDYNEFIVKISYIKDKDIKNYMDSVKTLLSKREFDVFSLLILGKTDTEISDELFISHHTIKTHNRSIYKKLNVSNRIELIEKVGDEL